MEILEEWDIRKERMIDSQREPVKIELEGMDKTTLVEVELMKEEAIQMTELLRRNKGKFTLPLTRGFAWVRPKCSSSQVKPGPQCQKGSTKEYNVFSGQVEGYCRRWTY